MLACPAFAKRLISIHALRKESDKSGIGHDDSSHNFNPRSP